MIKKLVSRGSNNENFTPRSWDLNSYLGCEAQIRLVDYETGGWGHIHADRFVLSSVPSTKVQVACAKFERHRTDC